MSDPTDNKVDDATRNEEQREAQMGKDAGPMPTPEEEAAAEQNEPASPETAANYQEQMDRSKDLEGEGRIP